MRSYAVLLALLSISLPATLLPAKAQGVLIIPATEPFQTYIPEDMENSENMDGSEMEHSSGMQHSEGENGMGMGVGKEGNMGGDMNMAPVSEPGQSAFAAIAEIVAKLDADPETDWSMVDITALREHLRDMDIVTLNSKASANDIEGGIEFIITGDENTIPSIQRMVTAHAQTMGGKDGWEYSTTVLPNGASMSVSVPPSDMAKLKALGFYGVLALGAHHQAHHWAMATQGGTHN